MTYDAVSMATLVRATMAHRELDVTEVDADPVVRRKLSAAISQRMTEAFELAWWPLFMLTEERAFRDAWAVGTIYGIGDEVFRIGTSDDGRYYESLTAGNVGHAPESSASDWAALPAFDRTIPWRQASKEWIGTPKSIWSRDPTIYSDSYRLPFGINSNGVVIPPSCVPRPTVFLEFRTPAPVLTYEEYQGTRPYLVGEAAYDATTAESYLCIADSTGDAVTDANHWTVQRVPRLLHQIVALLAAADEWEAAGNSDKYQVFQNRGLKELARQRERSITQPASSPNDCMTA